MILPAIGLARRWPPDAQRRRSRLRDLHRPQRGIIPEIRDGGLTLVDWLLAVLPIAMILVLLVGFRWGAARAGAAGWLTAAAVASLHFGAGPQLLAFAQAKALLLSLDVLLIVWAAFLLFRVSDEAGGIRTIGALLPRLTTDRAMQAMLIGWIFASFLQGVGGFGVPVAVTAPLLIGAGFSPLAAMVIPSIGHGWAVTFGSLASSFQALLAATNLPGELLAAPAAILLGFCGVATGFLVAHAAEGLPAIRRLALPIILIGVTMAAAQLMLASAGLWNIAGFGGGIAGLLIALPLARRYRQMGDEGKQGKPDRSAIWIALSGYLALLVITLGVQLTPVIRETLGSWGLRIWFPALRTSQGFATAAGYGRIIYPLTHAGASLGLAALIAYLVARRRGVLGAGAGGRIVGSTVRRVSSSSLSIIILLGMAVIMAHAGMTEILAQGLAQGVGHLFPLASAWIGGLGAFMTGSNTNSNVLFALLQQRTAGLLGISVPWILAAQTAGGAIGSVIAPTKIVVGSATAGMAGKEGSVLRALLPSTGILLGLISLALWLILRIG